MSRRFLPLLLGSMLLCAAGCQHEPDGTVVVPRSLDYRRFWEPSPHQIAQRNEASAFPVAPARPVTHIAAPVRQHARQAAPARDAVQAAGPAGNTVRCHDASEPGRRFRVVCD